MDAVEELTALRKSHASLQRKYEDECAKNAELRIERSCLKESEALLTKYTTVYGSSMLTNIKSLNLGS